MSHSIVLDGGILPTAGELGIPSPYKGYPACYPIHVWVVVGEILATKVEITLLLDVVMNKNY